MSTRPNLLLVLPPLAWLAWRERRREAALAPGTPEAPPPDGEASPPDSPPTGGSTGAPWSRRLGVLLVVAVAGLGPVVAHNSRLTGHLTGVATNGGINFLLAHCRCRTLDFPPGGRMKQVSANVNRRYFTETLAVDHLPYEEGAFYREGLRRVAASPSTLLLGLRNLAEGLGFGRMGPFPEQAYWPGWMGHDAWFNPPARAIAVALVSVLARVAWAARGGPRLTRAHALVLAVLSSLVPVFLVYIGDPRVRVSLDPLLLALTAEAWWAGGRALVRSRGARAPRGAPPGSGSDR